MEETVALDSSKQKQFVKSIKGIKKLLKGKQKPKLKKGVNDSIQIGKVKKHKPKKRGLVYLSHIPHGFYEHQMTEYFKQFGVVTNARVIRSKRTGMSKGHAFVEFKDTNVAEIVAETMNNYLMGKRLIKAAVIPPEKQRRFAKRKHWNAQNNPGNDLRQKMKKAHNSIKDENQELKIARRLLSNISKTKQKLQKLDINYDFFTPVDIPDSLLTLVGVKNGDDAVSTAITKKEKKPKVKAEKEETVEITSNKAKKKKFEEIKEEDVKSVKDTEVSDANKPKKKSNKTKKPDSNKDSKPDTKIPQPEKVDTAQKKRNKLSIKALKGNIENKLKESKISKKAKGKKAKRG